MNQQSQDFWGYTEKRGKDQGYKHLFNYFLHISKQRDFLRRIRELREKYDIPTEGFPKTEHDKYNAWAAKYNETYSKPIYQEVYKICEDFSLPKEWWKAVMEALFHDSKDVTDLGFGTTSGTCKIAETGEKISKDYPIAIMVNPYASQRDILEFVKLVYTHEIEPLQKRYKKESILIGKVKSKDPEIKKRDDFIYSNRHLPRKKIVNLVEKNFSRKLSDPINEGSVGKIISIQKERRKDL